MRAVPLWLLLAACQDYEIVGKVDDATVVPTSSVTDVPACDDPMPPTFAPSVEPSCEGEPIVGAFDPVTEWAWTVNSATPGFEQIMATPVVGPLVSGGDPAIVFTAFSGGAYTSPGALVAVGGDGTTLWSVTDFGGAQPYSSSGVAVADLGDGLGPAVLVSGPQGLIAANGDGSLRWVSPVPVSLFGNPAVGDVEGDGVAEIACGSAVVNANGSIRWIGGSGTGGFMSFFADVDGDGLQELVTGSAVYEPDGSIHATDGGYDGFPAIADLQGDGSPEVIVVAGSTVRAWDANTGALEWTAPLQAGGGGAPTVADLDGDGLPEIGTADSTYYEVFDGDGTRLWADTIQDFSSAVTSSSVFDFEGDGAAEIVYADEETLWVFDGKTGAVEMAWSSHSSGTLYEYPVIVDIDADGSAEIVVASNDYAIAGSHGITVIGDRTSSWAPARAVWNQHAYHIENVADDGTIPRHPTPSWTTWNSFRAGNSETATGLAQPDVAVGEPEICLTTCGASVSLWVPVENQATRELLGVDVAIRDGAGAEVARQTLPIPVGAQAWAGPFEVPTAAWSAGAVTVVVDPDDRLAECDESDDSWTLAESPCP